MVCVVHEIIADRRRMLPLLSRLSFGALTLVLGVVGSSQLNPALAASGVTRSQTQAVSGAIENQLRQNVRPWPSAARRHTQHDTGRPALNSDALPERSR